MEDLTQIGCIGLLKAIDKFDLSYEVRFSTYAVPIITGEVKRFLRDDGMIKVSRTLKETAQKAKYAGEQLAGKLGREPTLAELSEAMGLPAEELAAAGGGFHYELVCGIGKRVPRVYIKNGKIVETV